MSYKLEFFDLERLIKTFGYSDFESKIMANYLDEYVDYDFDLSFWLWNVAGQFTRVIKGNRDKAMDFIKDELGDVKANIYEFDKIGGCFVCW